MSQNRIGKRSLLQQAVMIALLLLPAQVVGASTVNVILTLFNGEPFDQVNENENYTIELWLESVVPTTTALSAYQFSFNGGDFATGKLHATNWAESSAFIGLSPPWASLDQSLDTAGADYVVDGVSGSLSPPFVGPALPLSTPALIGTFNVFVNAAQGDSVDFLLSGQSGIDDQDGNLGGGGLKALGVIGVEVTPEPNALWLVLFGGGIVTGCRRRSRRSA